MEDSAEHQTPAAVPLGKNPLTPRVGGCVDPRTRLDFLEKRMLFTSNVNQNQSMSTNWGGKKKLNM